jgi:hypothetical protein
VDKVQKIVEGLWNNKERMVLGIMILVLLGNIYNVLNPPKNMPLPPRPVPSSTPEGIQPNPPPPSPQKRPAEDWSSVYKRNPFWYFSTPASAGGGGKQVQEKPDIAVTMIRSIAGKPRARLKTASREGWYTEGQKFESFELQKIDTQNNTCQVYSERHGKVFTIALESR